MFHSRRQFVWLLSILLIIGFLATSLISYNIAHKSVSSQITETTLPLTSDNIYSEIQHDLLRPIFIASLMAQDTFVRDWALEGEKDPKAMIRYLKEIQQRYNTITSFYVSEKSRRYFHSTGILKTISEHDPGDEWYFRTKALASGNDYEVNIDSDTADRTHTTVFVNYRLFDYQGNRLGITGVGLAIETVKELIEAYQQRYGRRVYFIDRQGVVQLHGESFEGESSIQQQPGLGALATQILTSPSSSFSYQLSGKTIYVNSRLVPEFNWYLMVEQAEDPAEERLFNTLMVNLLISLGVTAVILLLTYLTVGNYQRRLEEMASTDKLTGITNRQVFDSLFDNTLKARKRHKFPLSLVIFDIDLFKRINDNYGHLTGDLVLQTVATIAKDLIRESDTICRWGGEEFIILLPDCDHEKASELAERIRSVIAHRTISSSTDEINITASFGVAQYHNSESSDELINRADQALFQSKRRGRNCVTTHQDSRQSHVTDKAESSSA